MFEVAVVLEDLKGELKVEELLSISDIKEKEDLKGELKERGST